MLPVYRTVMLQSWDMARALALVQLCQPPLPEDAYPARCFDNGSPRPSIVSAARTGDVDRLQDELLVTHATHDADYLR